MEVVTLSLGRGILQVRSRERERMQGYAQHLDALHVIVFTRKKHGYRDIQHDETLTIYPTNSVLRVTMLWDAFLIVRMLAKKNRTEPLIISAQDPLEIGWLAWLLSWYRHTRLHIQVHGDYFGTGWVGHSPVRWVRRFFARMLLKRAPSIRVVSERIKYSLVVRGIRESKITVLPIRPELENFLLHTTRYHEAPPYTFLFVGRLAPEKNIIRIIRAFARVHQNYSETQLRLVGGGVCESSLKKYAEIFGIAQALTWIPWTQDVAQEMEHADVFVLASKHEAYGLVLLEAMAVGLPLITTDVGCVGEVVRDTTHGIVVYDTSDDAYTEAMIHMITDHAFREQCGRNAKKTAHTIAETTAQTYTKAWVSALTVPTD